MTELSQETRALIERVSQLDDPSVDDRERIKQRLLVQLGTAAFVSGALATQAGQASVAAAKTGLFGTMGKVALCAGALCAVGGALLLDWPLKANEQSARDTTQPALITQPQQPPVEVATSAAEESEPVTEPTREEPSQPAVSQPAPRARTKSSVRAEKASEPSAPSTLAEELLLLTQAQAALRSGQHVLALELTREHMKRYPTGVMSEERMGVAALAQCELAGSNGDGAHKLAAQQFLERAPNSPLAARVRKACGVE